MKKYLYPLGIAVILYIVIDLLLPLPGTNAENEPLIEHIPVPDILVPARYYPSGWETDIDCLYRCSIGRHAVAGQIAYLPGQAGKVIQVVYWFDTIDGSRDYWKYVREVYRLEDAEEITYHSLYSHDEVSRCAKDPVHHCRVITRYRNIVIEWYINVYEPHAKAEGMPLEAVDPFLTAADAYIGAILLLDLEQ